MKVPIACVENTYQYMSQPRKVYIALLLFTFLGLNTVFTNLQKMSENNANYTTCSLALVKSKVVNHSDSYLETRCEFTALCGARTKPVTIVRKCNEAECMQSVIDDFKNPPRVAYELEDESITLEKPVDFNDLFQALNLLTWTATAGLFGALLCS